MYSTNRYDPLSLDQLKHVIVLALFSSIVVIAPTRAQEAISQIRVAPRALAAQLLENEDTDGDRKITVHDPFVRGTDRGDKVFWFASSNGRRYQVAGVARLANLLQELTLLGERDSAWLMIDRIVEPPAEHISRSIRGLFWNDLTRTIDGQGLPRLFDDEKTTNADGYRYVYVPASDAFALEYFRSLSSQHPSWRLRVKSISRSSTRHTMAEIGDRHGILTLALRKAGDGQIRGAPFVVPGGRFNEMYGWDSYFIILGLLQDGHIDLARGMVDNLVYEIKHYGAILNANRSYYLTRSQPPFLTSAAIACFRSVPESRENNAWLRTVLDAAIREYRSVWMGPERLLGIGLSRYHDSGTGVPPEVEAGHYDSTFAMYARAWNMETRPFESGYRKGTIRVPELDTFFVHDRAMRESGHDTSYRLLSVCADLATVDLNSLLYKIEVDIAECIRNYFGDTLRLEGGEVERSQEWFRRAEQRRDSVNRYLWNSERGMYFDYNVRTRSQTGYMSATTFWPLWAGLASRDQAERVVDSALPFLESPGGLAATAEISRGRISADRPQRQWDYPNGWAPHQMLAWGGLGKYGYQRDVQRLVYKWLFTITLNAAQYNGTVPEKLDVVRRTHEVYAEYGNVGTKFDYITREGFGWTNASYEVGLALLTRGLRDSLNRLIPPEFLGLE